jgi:hypothetical protein
MNRSIIVMILLLTLSGTSLAQPCRPQLQMEPPVADQWTLEQFADGQSIRIPFRISVSANQEDCPFLATFDFVHSQQVQVHVEGRPFGQPLLDLTASDPRRVLSGVASRGSPVLVDLDLVVTPGPRLRAQRINIQLITRLYSGTDPSNAVETERVRQRISLDIPARATLNVRSDLGDGTLGSAPAFLLLGDLISGSEKRAFLSLEGNVPVTLNVTASQGVLVHTEFPQYTVPYSIVLGGVEGPGTAGLGTRMEPGETVVLTVSVGELETLVAGDYQDVLQITMTVD